MGSFKHKLNIKQIRACARHEARHATADASPMATLCCSSATQLHKLSQTCFRKAGAQKALAGRAGRGPHFFLAAGFFMTAAFTFVFFIAVDGTTFWKRPGSHSSLLGFWKQNWIAPACTPH